MTDGVDEPDFIPDLSRKEGGLRVIEHDALLSVEPARGVIDAGDHRLDADGGELVDERRAVAGGIGSEHLALPREVVDEVGDQAGPKRAGPDDGFACGIALGNRAGRMGTEDLVEGGLGLTQQIVEVHSAAKSAAGRGSPPSGRALLMTRSAVPAPPG